MVNIGATSAPQMGLSVSGLTVAYDGPPVLIDVSLDVGPGEIVALLGPSGSGKTTLLRSVAGLEKPASGSVSLGERIVSDRRTFLAPERRRVGMVFQDGALFPHLDVSRNVAYGLPRAERSSDRVTEALSMVGLSSMAHRMPGSLSGGQRQRVALARALAASPGVLCLDEPLSALDEETHSEICDLLGELHRELDVTILHITHSNIEAKRLGETFLRLEEGKIIEVNSE